MSCALIAQEAPRCAPNQPVLSDWQRVSFGGRQIRVKICPPPGGGVHSWAYHAWHAAIEAGLCETEADTFCSRYATRPLTSGDLPRGGTRGAGVSLRRPRAEYCPKKLADFAARAAGFGTEDLMSRSPTPTSPLTPSEFLQHISSPGESRLLFDYFESQGQYVWRYPEPNTAPQVLDRFINPTQGKGSWFLINPVDGQWRMLPRLRSERNPQGKTRRAEENLTSFPYLLLESDAAPADLWIAALAQLQLPIAAVYESGGKSIHALVKVAADTGEVWRARVSKIKAPLIALGADSNAMTAVRLSRLPQCYRRETNRWQRLLYLNSSPDGTPIIEQPTRQRHN